MPFWITPGPKIFQRTIANILEGIETCFVFIDDIILYLKSQNEHTILATKLLKRLYEMNIKINFNKSKFFRTRLKFWIGCCNSPKGIPHALSRPVSRLHHEVYFLVE